MMSAFDAWTMAAVADELKRTVIGGRFQAVVQVDAHSVGLELYAGERRYLLVSIHPQRARVHLMEEKPRRGAGKPTPLLLLLRKYVRGARLIAVQQPPFERILELRFQHSRQGATSLIAEVMGRHSNLILTDASGRILDALKRVGPDVSRARTVLPGQPYVPPPPQEKRSPLALTEASLRVVLASAPPGSPLWRALVAGVQGLSPLLAREIAFQALDDAEAKADTGFDRLGAILEAVQALLSPAATARWQPCLIRREGKVVAYAAYPLTHLGEPEPVPSISAAIVAYQAQQDGEDAYRAIRTQVASKLAAAREKLIRQQDALQRQLVDPAALDQWRRSGEWILAYAHAIRPGQAWLEIDEGDGEKLRIQLDPARSPAENAQGYFERYRKGKRAMETVPALLRKLDAELAYLDELAHDLAQAEDRPQIAAVAAALAEAGYDRPRRRSDTRPDPGRPLRVETDDGFTIWVGRNSRQNEEVTFRLAAADDLWLHVVGVPGAHVVIQKKGGEVPDATIRRAAALAAYFSQAREEATVDVAVTKRRLVRRRPGGRPGQVTYRGERVVRVAPQLPEVED